MNILQRILWADDFSAASKNVQATAVELARIFDSTVVPVHVLPNDILNDTVREHAQKIAREKLEEAAKQLKKAGVEVGEPMLMFGSPHGGIVKAAVQANANLILAGSGEGLQGGNSRLGTTTERIIQNSEKPVFVVKAGKPLNVKQILCPVDFSAASERALSNAITMTRKFNAHLTVQSVCEEQGASWFTSEKDRQTENKVRLENHHDKFDAFLEKFNLHDLEWTKEASLGSPADEISRLISTRAVDLLIMGTAGRTGLNRLFIGSVTEKVIRDVPTTFLTLKSEDVINLQMDTDIKDLEQLYNSAVELMANGFYDEAIMQFKACLSISNMHVPAYLGIAKVHDKLNHPEKAEQYRRKALDIKDRMWYAKIEDEVRKLRGS